MQPMKLLVIGNFIIHKQGYSSVSYELASRLQSRGHVVYIASHISNRMFRVFDMVLKTITSAWRVDVVMIDVYSGNAFLWAMLVSCFLNLLNKPFILILRGGNLPVYASRNPVKVGFLLRNAKAIVAPSYYLQAGLLNHAQNIHVIVNPIDIEKYQKRHIEDPQPRLLWLRSFHKIYNPSLALKVMQNLLEMYPNIRLEMIGPDKKDGTLEALYNLLGELKINDSVKIAGSVEKTAIPVIMKKHDIFLNTTNIDNTPVSVMEAMAGGLCIVSTNVGGIPYLLEDDQDALLVNPNDVQAMAYAVGRILTVPGLAARLSQNARQKVEQFDWSIVLPQWEKLLQEVIEIKYG